MKSPWRMITALLGWLLLANARLLASEPMQTPEIHGDWWQIASDPDLGELTTSKQQPVDFGIWQAADGTWQLWSCIRNTKETGKTRLFYRWEGAKITDAFWKPIGIAMRADPQTGETPGGLQAPFVFKHDGHYSMTYGCWDGICLAASADGKQFNRRVNEQGKAPLFGADKNSNPRDPMVIRIGELWYCYYTAHPKQMGADYCRTSKDLIHWSEPHLVASGGKAGTGPYSAECPFVLEQRPGHYYLFRTQHYGKDAQTSVYHSTDPLNFGINGDGEHFVCTLAVAAPEIFRIEDKWYIAALLPSLKGIQLNRLEWVCDCE